MREVFIGLLGLGTVGAGVVEILRRHAREWQTRYNFQPVLKKILVQNLAKQRVVDVDSSLLTTDYREIIDDPEIQVVIEVMGGEEPTLTIAKEALLRGKHLITANKKMLALHGPTLFKIAQNSGVQLAFEASVGGGIPIIRPLQESLNSNAIQSLTGIINGTTNYILTAMAVEDADYFEVLRRAQALGYAELDPSSDVEGLDACYKLSVLTAVAFGEQLAVAAIRTEGICGVSRADIGLARELGYTIKLLAKAEKVIGSGSRTTISAHVHPTLLPLNHPLAAVSGVNNALVVKGDAVGEVMFMGPGAGMMATGSAVVSDLLQVCKLVCNELYHEKDYTIKGVSPTDLSVESTVVRNAYFFLTIATTSRCDVAKVTLLCSEVGLTVHSIFTKDGGDLYYTGIMTGLTNVQVVSQVVAQLAQDNECRKCSYYYVEGGNS